MKMRGINNKNLKKYYLIILFAVVLFLLPTHPAKASCVLGWDPISSCILEGTSYFVYLIFIIIGKGIAVLATALQAVINIPVYPDDGIAVIYESWKIMRNFANMFFIVALIMMAFATIFDVVPELSKYNARTLFGRFLFTALLINFSMVLGIMVIHFTQVLSNTFLTAIGDMSSRLGQTLNPSQLITPSAKTLSTAATAVDNATFGAFIKLIFALVLAGTFLFSLLTALIFTLIRIPILWALLVVSPIAWILNIFPSGEGTFKKWWHTFIGWNMFLPIFLFFLYFGLYFLSNQTEVMNAIAKQSANQSLGDGVPLDLQTLFFYVLAAIFLIGGTIVAMKASMFSGTGVVQVAGWAKRVVLKTPTPLGSAESWQKGAQQKWQEMQTEGYGIGKYRFGGSRAGEAEALRRARMLGTKGALEKGVESEKERQKPYANDVNRLRDMATSGSREQRLAARSRLTELGDKKFLTAERINETYQMYGGDRSESANKYISSIDFTKLDEAARKRLSDTMQNIEALKKNAMAMIEKDKLDENEIVRLAGQFTNEEEVKEFLNKGQKKNLIDVARARVKLKLAGVGTIDEEIEKAFKKLTDDQIVETMSDPSFNSSNPDYQIMVREMDKVFKNNPKRLENLVAKATGDVRAKLDPLLKVVRTTKIKPLATKGQKLTSQIRQAQQNIVNFDYELVQLNDELNKNNNPNSDPYKQLQRDIARLEGQRVAKENEIKSLQDKRTKIGEQIKGITSGTPTTP